MQSRFTSTALALLIAAVCAGAQAQSRTREEVRKELADAMREGNMPHGEFVARQQLPGADTAMQRRTRDDVLAELEAAQRSGDMLAAGESSQKLNELYASSYPQQPMVAGRTRAQVLAELTDAQRNGELLAPGELSLTQRELHPGQYPRVASPVFASAAASAVSAAPRHTMR